MRMPAPEESAFAQRDELIADLRAIVRPEHVIVDETALRVYESDGLTAYRQRPLLVVLPETTAEVSAVLGLCDRRAVKVVPRGAGTSLSGGILSPNALATAALAVRSRALPQSHWPDTLPIPVSASPSSLPGRLTNSTSDSPLRLSSGG